MSTGKRKRATFVVWVLGCSLLLGCVPLATSGSSDDSLRGRLDRDATDLDRTVVEGALIGGVVGGLIGEAVSSDGDKTEGRNRGAAIGFLGGILAGKAVAKRKAQYAAAEDSLDALIASTQQRNERLESLVVTAQSLLAEDRASVADLKQRLAAAQLGAAAAHQTLAQLEASKASVQKAIDAAQKNHDATLADIERHEESFPDSGRDERIDSLVASYEQDQSELERVRVGYDDMIGDVQRVL